MKRLALAFLLVIITGIISALCFYFIGAFFILGFLSGSDIFGYLFLIVLFVSISFISYRVIKNVSNSSLNSSKMPLYKWYIFVPILIGGISIGATFVFGIDEFERYTYSAKQSKIEAKHKYFADNLDSLLKIEDLKYKAVPDTKAPKSTLEYNFIVEFPVEVKEEFDFETLHNLRLRFPTDTPYDLPDVDACYQTTTSFNFFEPNLQQSNPPGKYLVNIVYTYYKKIGYSPTDKCSIDSIKSIEGEKFELMYGYKRVLGEYTIKDIEIL